MTYHYKAKAYAELEHIAQKVLDRFPDRRNGLAVDIEGILEDLELELMPRRNMRQFAEAYLASDPRYIVVDESIFTYLPRARFTLAHEVCHLILEYDLWKDGTIPPGAESHKLSRDAHYYVERDAKSMAAALRYASRRFSGDFWKQETGRPSTTNAIDSPRIQRDS